MTSRSGVAIVEARMLDATDHLRGLAHDSGFGELWADLANAAQAQASEIGTADAVDDPRAPALLGDRADLAAALSRYARTSVRFVSPGRLSLDSARPCDELWERTRGLNPALEKSLEIVLRRALAPTAALRTWPLAALFDRTEERALLAAERSDEPVQAARLSWRPDFGMDYAGYVCAIVKFTRLCNLRCVYCHDWRAGPGQVMRFPVQLKLFERLLSPGRHATVDVVWHGGEPTLLGRREFLRILAIQEWFRRPGQVIRNRVQTNGTTLGGDWPDFLARYEFRVGVSLDGPPQLHDQTRRDVRGRATFTRVRESIRRLRVGGLLEHVYLVATERLIEFGADRVIAFLQEEGITNVGVLPVRPANGPVQPGEVHLPRARYVQFLQDLHCARAASPEPWVGVRELDAAIRAARGEMPGHCEVLGNCVGAFFSIEPNGAVAHCNKFVGDGDYTLGDIFQSSFDDLARGTRAEDLRASNAEALEHRSACPYVGYCQGWCPHERYVGERHEPGYRDDCCGLRPLFESLSKVTGP